MTAPAFLTMANELAAKGFRTGLGETPDGRPLLTVEVPQTRTLDLDMPGLVVRVVVCR